MVGSRDLSDAESVFENLRASRMLELDSYLSDKMEGGLDAYCPRCDKAYCREQYNVEE